MTLESQLAELLRKPWLRPGEAMLVLGVTSSGLRAIREARPDVARKFPGMGHHRYVTAIVVELMGGSSINRDGRAPAHPNQ